MSKAYIDDYTATLKTLLPDGTLPQTIDAERKLLKELEKVEKRSLDRVSASGIFADLTSEKIRHGAQRAVSSGRVQFRCGFEDFMTLLRQRREKQIHDVVSILSVNWSCRFISSCLEVSGCPVPESRILSNELKGVQEGRSSNGHIVAAENEMIISSDNKLQQLKSLREENRDGGDSVPIVYLGDSGTDFEALLAADMGICIRDEPMGSSQRKLAETLERLGIRCPRLRDWKELDQHGCAWVKDFEEIKDWIEDTTS